MTYAQLERSSYALAVQLRKLGVGRGDRVAILAERGPGLVWSMLAVLRCGGVFIVLDHSYPERRLEALLEICAPQALLIAGGDALTATADRLARPDGLPIAHAGQGAPPEPLEDVSFDPAAPEDPAYFLFTSGSTGHPKCVACNHIPLTHFTAWQTRAFDLTAADRFTMLAGLSHDPLLRDIFTPLSIGASLAIPRQATITQPGALAPWFERVGATVSHMTPAMGQLLAAGGDAVRLPKLRRIFWGGDQLKVQQVAQIARLAPGAVQINFYGCTETPQAVGYYRCEGGEAGPNMPVGRGVDGFELVVVDAQKRPVASGETGEVTVRSSFLSMGYVDKGRVRAAADGAEPGVYSTGDQGVLLPGGDIVLSGRGDDQIKLRGFRIDLSEITGALLTHPGVDAAIALKLGDGAHAHIDGFVAPRASKRGILAETEIAQHLAANLPAYMTPRRIWVLPDGLPLSPNGKIDRDALRAYAKTQADIEADALRQAAPAMETRSGGGAEQALIKRWADLFSPLPISRQTSFISIGGDSLSYVAAYLATEEVVGAVPAGWAEMSLADLAATQVKRSRFWATIDTSMLIRAVSIVLIVAAHFRLSDVGYGFSGALFITSGFLFGQIQLREHIERYQGGSVLKAFRNIFIPTAVFTTLACLTTVAKGDMPPLNILTFNADITDFVGELGSVTSGNVHGKTLWYVDSLLKDLLILFLVVRLVPRKYLAERRLQVILAVFLAAWAAKFIGPALFQPGFLDHGAPNMTVFALTPFGTLATFTLGATLASGQTMGSRVWLSLLLLAYVIFDAHFFGLTNGLAIGGGGMLLLFVSRVRAPRTLATLALILSGASLYIYLTQFIFGGAIHTLHHGQDWPVVQFVAALAGGVAVHRVWTFGAKHLAGWVRMGFAFKRLAPIAHTE